MSGNKQHSARHGRTNFTLLVLRCLFVFSLGLAPVQAQNLLEGARVLMTTNLSDAAASWAPRLTFDKQGRYGIRLKAEFNLPELPSSPMLSLRKPDSISDWTVNGQAIIAPPKDTQYPVLEGIPTALLKPGANVIEARFTHRVELRDEKLVRPTVGDINLGLRPTDLRTFDIHTGPVLGAAGYDYFTVGCRTRMPATVTLHCDGRTWTTKPGVIHRLRADGLREGQEYEYRLEARLVGGEATASSKTWKVKTLSRQGPWTFVALGDARNNPRIWTRIAEQIQQFKPQFALHTGDIVGNGNLYEAWDTEFAKPAAEFLATVPCFYTFGNHENNVSMLYEFFGFPQDDRSSYTQQIGPIQIFAMNRFENWGRGSSNLVRMEKELAASTAPFIIAFTHPPAWSSGSHGNDKLGNEVHFPILARYGVTALIAGHDHCYERSEVGGTTMLITGGGGAPLYQPAKAKDNPHSQVFRSEYNFIVFQSDGRKCEATAYTFGERLTPDEERKLEAVDRRAWEPRKVSAATSSVQSEITE